MTRLSNKVACSSNKGVLFFLLTETPVGVIYRKFFKKTPYIRAFLLYVWRRLFPLSIVIVYPFFKSVRRLPLVSLSGVTKSAEIICLKELVSVYEPLVFPGNFQEICRRTSQSGYYFPNIYIARLENSIVRGGSGFIFKDNSLVCHDMFDARHDYTHEEFYGRLIIRPVSNFAYYLKSSSVQLGEDTISEAAIFTDAVSGNYAHFITEVLPRIHMFVKHGPAGVPLLVNSGLHDNILMALRMIVGEERQLIDLAVDKYVTINRLHVISPCGYIPYERRPGAIHLAGHSDGIFSPTALRGMRDVLRDGITVSDAPRKNKIYIKRNSHSRNLINALDIEALLLGDGFEVVEPERLDFYEQVRLFSNAEVIIGATGAAFANLVFCKPDVRIIIMISRNEIMPYYYWQNMANATGNRVIYVFGDSGAVASGDIHGDFSVSLADVQHVLATR